MSTCLHSRHGFRTYGETTYSQQTCKKCLLTAYQRKIKTFPPNTVLLPLSRNSEQARSGSFSTNTDGQTPITDTISHFPSPGGEAMHEVFKPHLPMINRESDVRPKEVPRFISQIDPNSHELLEGCKTPWEQEKREPILSAEDIEDEKPALIKSIAEEKNEEILRADSLLEDKEHLHEYATQQFYKTSTQRMYEGVDWKSVLKPSQPPPFRSNNSYINNLNHQIKRYHHKPEKYQSFENTWDSVQSRNGYCVDRPISFCSTSKKSQQIPNYQGNVNGIGEKDILHERYKPLTVLRTQQPKYQETSRKPHIPGYTGSVLWSQSRDVYSDERLPRVESTARSHHRFATYPANMSMFSHKSPLSKTVSLTHPFVPYNNVNYALNRTASGNRVY